jgi:hypothetical protein
MFPASELELEPRHCLGRRLFDTNSPQRHGFALIGKWTKKPQRGRVVPAIIGSRRIFKRPGNHRHGAAEENRNLDKLRRD